MKVIRYNINMNNIDRLHIIDENNLSGENYFSSLVSEAYSKGLLLDFETEKLQMDSLDFLAYKCEIYNGGDSSSIKTEVAESLMKSNLYTVGLYLKSLTDPDFAVQTLKTEAFSELYNKGRKIVGSKYRASKHVYMLVLENRLKTPNYTYNSTIDLSGIGVFFKMYSPDFEAHEIPASIDYQLCNPIEDLAGIEFIQKYLESLFCENEFCKCFEQETIDSLLLGYDSGYKDLLINIFEEVLTAALGCILTGSNPLNLNIQSSAVLSLYRQFMSMNKTQITTEVDFATDKLFKATGYKNPSLRKYIEKSLSKIVVTIDHAVKTKTLEMVFPALKSVDISHEIQFFHDKKMDNKEYCNALDELMLCDTSAEKMAVIKSKIKTFGDLEDIIFDAELDEKEIREILTMLDDSEIAVLVKRHWINYDIMAVDLTEMELLINSCLKNHMKTLGEEKEKEIFQTAGDIIDD